MDDSPNSPNFLLAKLSRFMVFLGLALKDFLNTPCNIHKCRMYVKVRVGELEEEGREGRWVGQF